MISRVFRKAPRGALPAVAAFGILLGAGPARAASCPTDNVVYVTGSSAIQPLLAAVARAVLGAVPPITVIYQKPGSCTGVSEALNGTAIDGQAAIVWLTAGDPDSGNACTIPTAEAGSTVVDIGVSDVFAESCQELPSGLPKGFFDFTGPIQTETFIVPKGSSRKSISADAAYFVWGFGADSGVSPWTNNGQLFRRNVSSGTQTMISFGIGVPANLWKGVDGNGSLGVLTNVAGASAANLESTLGILALTDLTGANSALAPEISVLAYEHFDQSCGYYPSTTAVSKDLHNVRDGHYALWGPLHFITHVDATGFASNPLAKQLISYLTGATPPPNGVDLIQLEATNNVIPSCAMRVQRTSEIGPLSSFAPADACYCYYDVQATGQTSPCQACKTSATCPTSAPNCSYGYCETQ